MSPPDRHTVRDGARGAALGEEWWCSSRLGVQVTESRPTAGNHPAGRMGGCGAGLRRAGCGLRVVQLAVGADEPGQLLQPGRPCQQRPGHGITVGDPD